MGNGFKTLLTVLAVLGLAVSASASIQYSVSDLNAVPGGPSAYGIDNFGLMWSQSIPTATAQVILDGVLTDLNDLLLPGSGWDLLTTFSVDNGSKQITGAGEFGGEILPFLLTPPGDADGDGDIDGADLSVWQVNYSLSVGPDRGFWTGDWTSDGIVDSRDLALWQQNYCPLGLDFTIEMPPLGNNMGLVPEPASMLLLMLSVALAGPKIRRAFKRS